MSRALWFVFLLPRNLCVLILRVYRAVVSPLYGDVCRYYPSCSSYALQAIQRHGVIRGTWLGSVRIVRCHPWAAGGVDDVPEGCSQGFSYSPFGFVSRAADKAPQSHSRPIDLVDSHGKG
ncbi:MAG: yidD [Microbacteriaceae bacterium]|jgi:putative membrane protein insertion efficiency factor|nr:yidD [Microbacteriaceae bacterium]